MLVQYARMRDRTIANLLVKIFRGSHLVYLSTGWSDADLEVDKPVPWPKFEFGPPNGLDSALFYSLEEHHAVKCIYRALRELSSKSLNLKLGMGEKGNSSTNSVFSLDYDDYVFWARKSQWTATESAMLSVGLIPSESIHEEFNELENSDTGSCSLLREFTERVQLYLSAVQVGNIDKRGNALEIVDWFEKLELPMPEGLANAVRKFQGPPIATNDGSGTVELGSSEKGTLLKLVAAMSVENYGFDPSKNRNEATGHIRSDLEIVGLSLDSKTILRWLREASELVDEAYWKSNR
ncbi:MAG: hypothetical protein Q9M48_00800 [Rhodobacterales bacterium]|nr:hypothetical protein [Rhodobacterales bacterium]